MIEIMSSDEDQDRVDGTETEAPEERSAPCDDLVVARALRLFDDTLERPWTVEEIASELGVSRAALGRRFKDALGRAPLQVLRDKRMERAAELLDATELGLAAIGDEVGYDSEFAFSRAFFRHFGVRPGQYRRLGGSRGGNGPVMLAA